jgi:hypothetical protein
MDEANREALELLESVLDELKRDESNLVSHKVFDPSWRSKREALAQRPKQRKLSKKEKRKKAAARKARELEREVNANRQSTSERREKVFSKADSAFSNVYTSFRVFQGGSPGGGKRR